MCLRYVWSCVCVSVCVPDCRGLHLNRNQWLCVFSVIGVCPPCSVCIGWMEQWPVLMNVAADLYIWPDRKRQRCKGKGDEVKEGVRSCCLLGHASWNGNASFLFFNRIKEQEREETDGDSYGCLKERDKENRKEERRAMRSVRERRMEKMGCQGSWIQTRRMLSTEMFIDWSEIK